MNMISHLVVLLSLFLGAFDSTSAQCSMTNVTVDCLDQLGHGEVFAESVQLNSSANVTISVGVGNVSYGWFNLKRRMYNNKIAGPTITVKQGDTLNVTMINTLSDAENDLERPLNQHNHPNSTNLHTHGLHISSEDPQDNVLVHIKPGGSHDYSYQIHSQNAPGTNWYHAHIHGSTMFQVQGGLSGMLIVEDNVDDMSPELAAVSCPDNCDKDIQMLFQAVLQYTGFRGYGVLQDIINDYEGFKNDQYVLEQGGTLAEFLKENLHRFTTNGQLEPVLALDAGQMYRFRMANAGGRDTLELFIVDTAGQPTNACTIREIALDGVYLNEPRAPHNNQSLLVPGGRVDWLVRCDANGTYYIKSHAYPEHRSSLGRIDRFEGKMVKLTVSGDAVSPVQNFPTTLPARPSYMNDLRSVNETDIDGRFVIELDPEEHLNREHWSSPTNYRYKMKVGTIQEWNILNADANFSHPIHIHVNHFQVISYNEYTGAYGVHDKNFPLLDVKDRTPCLYQRKDYVKPERKKRSYPVQVVNQARRQTPSIVNRVEDDDPLRHLGHEKRFADDAGNTLGYASLGEWRDTLLIPSLSNITIRFIPHEHVGDVIIHCHILSHEDIGMMMIVKIVPEGESTDANIASGNAYPGTCRACDRYPFNNPETLGACNEAIESTTSSSSVNTSSNPTSNPTPSSAATSSLTSSITTTSGSQKMIGSSKTVIILLSTIFFTSMLRE